MFIEVFGLYLIENGLKVVVLVVDFSLLIIGGSIMGDKICMEVLFCYFFVFICFFLIGGVLGGVV